MTLYSILFPSISRVWEIRAGTVDRKNPTIGSNINSIGNKSSLILDKDEFLGLFLKSIKTIAIKAIKQDVKMKPARLGNLYPRVVLEKTGFINVIMFAATVNINQLTGQRK